MTATRLVCVGRSSGAFGLKGELRVFSYAEDPRLYTKAGQVFIGADPHNCEPFKVISHKPHGQRLLMQLEGLNSREDADLLKGQWLYLPVDILPPLADDEYYWHQAEGAKVYLTGGREIGVIQKVSNAGAHDLWHIKDQQGAEALFPMVPEFVLEMDMEAGRVVIQPPEGLFEAQGFMAGRDQPDDAED
jgi:16S rRNA processing protein RimM